MPASLFGDMDHHHHSAHTGGSVGLEDQRALQLALELSMLGLATNEPLNQGIPSDAGVPNESPFFTSADDIRNLLPKKSQNMTECVPVPSSEHVAEIVGRQGCKIKALRAKTNTYIKTPVRGEEPVFVVTGRKEDVALAKREILSAAEHFSQIRASRKGGSGNGGPTCAPAPVPGQVTIQVRVPYRVVGLVVGPKGATIKRIQQQTHTYIVTPSRDKDPVFEVTGLPDNVQMAKREIEAHIAIRTGSLPLDNQSPNGLSQDELATQNELLASLYKNGISGLGLEGLSLGIGLGAINSLSSSLSSVSGLGLGQAIPNAPNGNNAGSVGSSSSGGGSLSSLSSLNGFSSNLNNVNTSNANAVSSIYAHHHHNNQTHQTHHQQLTELGFSILDNAAQNGMMSSSRSEDSYLFGGSGPNSIDGSQTKLSDLFAATNANSVSVGSSLWGSFDRDEGLGESPTLESVPGSNMWPEIHMRPAKTGSPPGLTLVANNNANNGMGGAGAEQHAPARRMSSDPLLGLLPSVASSTGSGSISGPSSPTQLLE
jgi:RNA-binding protein MEX3